ncbi:MAG: hypothetical protein BJ554DRAFT_453 [Olpidium bornovanus]|uniref:Uncharacterized protein n=1 Tax=Olpidium bornovanus TaxID=278681 RepID=A0A8H7ZTF1_9FUNG|nr:MAG: hypothetical protein BJ554DRAFT_453 [Olpidium bornovanus]
MSCPFPLLRCWWIRKPSWTACPFIPFFPVWPMTGGMRSR